MIIGVEVKDSDLLISYYDAHGKISYVRKKIRDSECFNWIESDRPTINKNWDDRYVKSAKSDPKWLTRSRIEELILDKLTPSEIDTIYNFDNIPNIHFQDIEIQLTSDEFPDASKSLMPVNLISFCNEKGVTYILSTMKSSESDSDYGIYRPGGLLDEDISKMELEVNEYFKNTIAESKDDRKILDLDFKIRHKFFESEKELLEFIFIKFFQLNLLLQVGILLILTGNI